MSELFSYLLPGYMLIDIGAFIVLIVIVVGIFRRVNAGLLHFPIRQIWSMMQKGVKRGAGILSRGDLLRSLTSVLFIDVVTARTLGTCHSGKWASHVSIFCGFVFTGIATTLAYFFKPEGTILPLTNSIKIFGNLGGILLIAGCTVMFFVRYQESGSPWHVNPSDFFLIMLFLTSASGFVVQGAIYTFGRSILITSISYWLHMVLVILLLATAPFTKFVHSVYKPSWILHDNLERKFMMRRQALSQESPAIQR